MYVNNIEMPVTLYLSSDDQAPVITNANLSVILKACLVTGYGAKPGAGWTLPYEDAASNTRVFAPKHAGELDSYLRVKDNGGGDSIVQAYREMTGIGAGDKILELRTPYKYGRRNLTGRWAVIASERSIIMWVDSAYNYGPRVGQMLFYGDTASAHDGSRTLLLAHSGGDYEDGAYGSLFSAGANSSATVKAKSYRDESGTKEQGFIGFLADGLAEYSARYVTPILLPRDKNLYAVPGIYTDTIQADNLTENNDDGTPYLVLHSNGGYDLSGQRYFMRLVVRTDRWKY